ncbi:hypothetical protein Godav_009502 [Gossypium davidsonii]|uniref:Thaumatin-like protein n=1 Tax=Gossypium davidsonii TaxID=34287 RepID=A0A7J8SF38_GOSDV|nr:hypothetical protein [Gossypium davidsonii]
MPSMAISGLYLLFLNLFSFGKSVIYKVSLLDDSVFSDAFYTPKPLQFHGMARFTLRSILGSNRLHIDNSGSGKCVTGDCGGVLKCTGGGAPPVSLVEFTIAGGGSGDKDFYDVSLVDGYNVALGVRATGGSGDCQYAGCVSDLNSNCPPELQVIDSGSVVACKSACAAFNSPEFCCTGDHATPQTCSPTQYSVMFKNACPTAYSYAYDDASSTRTCSGSDYLITFCPTVS